MTVDYLAAQPQLNSAGIDLNDDFHILSSSQVETLVELAKTQSYRKPIDASGSAARMYFQALQRQYRKDKQ